MSLDFLDNGLPVESGNWENGSKDVSAFRAYCNSIGKRASELTEEELNAFYNTL